MANEGLRKVNDPELSIIIPCFNEENRLGRSLDQIVGFLQKGHYSFEIIVVDDGSRDRTSAVAEEKLTGFPHRILQERRNRGKGQAVKRGMLEAKGKYLLFTDADLSTPIEEAERLIHSLKNGFDVAIGSRGLRESQVEVHQNWLRETLGKIYNQIARLFIFKGISDSQCGFKCFPREVAREIFRAQKLKGFSFDAETIYLAQRRGYRVAEVPVIWRNSPKSRVRLLTDSWKMLIDLVRIPWIHR